jgi:hypothetical protein
MRALSELDEARGKVLYFLEGTLVRDADALGGIERRAAAESDDDVGFEALTGVHTSAHHGHVGVGGHVIKDVRREASRHQCLLDARSEAE